MSEVEEVEVNGKIDLGTRRLVLSHVENATTFYAYLEAEKEFMKEIKVLCRGKCEGLERLKERPQLEQAVGVYSSFDKCWFRGKVEQLDQGKAKNLFRVRMIDFGWNNLFRESDLCPLPDSLRDMKVLCDKYKMADIKPKGRQEGYSAEDRQRGAEWLKRTVNDRVVICSCYKQVKYAGGTMADCMVGDLNLNKAAMKQGHAILSSPLILGYTSNSNSTPSHHTLPYKPGQIGNQFSARFQNQLSFGAASNGTVDLDYSSYNGNSPFAGSTPPRGGRNGNIAQPRGLMPVTNGKSQEVKKLEKKINEDKKTINELRKTTNLDSGVKDISRLLDKLNQARANSSAKEAKGNYILASLAGVAEVIEECSVVTERFLSGIEAVEAAARLVSEDEKKSLTDGQRVMSTQSKSDLHKCISQYLEVYSDQVVDDELSRVNSQLTAMNPNIPSGWKLLAVQADVVTRVNLLEVAEKVKTWLEDSVTREAALTANSQKEVESLCRSLDLLSKGLLEKEGGNTKVELPTSLDSQLGSTRQALQAELAGLTGGQAAAAKKGGKKPGSDDAMVLRSAWKALTALKNQLEMAKEKSREYKGMF